MNEDQIRLIILEEIRDIFGEAVTHKNTDKLSNFIDKMDAKIKDKLDKAKEAVSGQVSDSSDERQINKTI